MSTNFTGYSGGTYDWSAFEPQNEVDAFMELSDAHSERYTAASLVSATAPDAVTKQIVDGFTFQRMGSFTETIDGVVYYAAGYRLKAYQQFVLNNITNTVDHTQDLTEFADVPYFTTTTFYAEAGMDAGGFRRYNGDDWDGTTDPTFEYGVIEAGDIIGWWIYEDLQRAFSTMQKFTATAYNPVPTTANYASAGNNASTWELSKSGIVYPGTPTINSGVMEAKTAGKNNTLSYLSYVRTNYKLIAAYYNPLLPCDANFYVKTGLPYYNFIRTGTIQSATQVYNDQGTGYKQDLFVLTETLPVAAGAEIKSTEPSGYDYADGQPPNWCSPPLASDPNGRRVNGFLVTANAIILEYDFTNSN